MKNNYRVPLLYCGVSFKLKLNKIQVHKKYFGGCSGHSHALRAGVDLLYIGPNRPWSNRMQCSRQISHALRAGVDLIYRAKSTAVQSYAAQSSNQGPNTMHVKDVKDLKACKST